jgi:hypothetical protein
MASCWVNGVHRARGEYARGELETDVADALSNGALIILSIFTVAAHVKRLPFEQVTSQLTLLLLQQLRAHFCSCSACRTAFF